MGAVCCGCMGLWPHQPLRVVRLLRKLLWLLVCCCAVVLLDCWHAICRKAAPSLAYTL